MCLSTLGSEIYLELGMETEVVKTLQVGVLMVICLVAVVMVGVEQGKKPSMDRPTDTKGELERLKEERQN